VHPRSTATPLKTGTLSWIEAQRYSQELGHLLAIGVEAVAVVVEEEEAEAEEEDTVVEVEIDMNAMYERPGIMVVIRGIGVIREHEEQVEYTIPYRWGF
jgi:hypothetical protein